MHPEQTDHRDPRRHKTREVLCTAIFRLMERNSFTDITVNDVCETAKISRTTFYQHFRDKYDLIRFALEQATHELRHVSEGSPEKEIHNLLDFVYKNRNVFKNLNEQNEELFYLLSEVSITSLNEYLEMRGNPPTSSPSILHSVFLAGGRAWLLLWWIRTNCKIPKEEMENYLVSVLKPRTECKTGNNAE